MDLQAFYFTKGKEPNVPSQNLNYLHVVLIFLSLHL